MWSSLFFPDLSLFSHLMFKKENRILFICSVVKHEFVLNHFLSVYQSAFFILLFKLWLESCEPSTLMYNLFKFMFSYLRLKVYFAVKNVSLDPYELPILLFHAFHVTKVLDSSLSEVCNIQKAYTGAIPVCYWYQVFLKGVRFLHCCLHCTELIKCLLKLFGFLSVPCRCRHLCSVIVVHYCLTLWQPSIYFPL